MIPRKLSPKLSFASFKVEVIGMAKKKSDDITRREVVQIGAATAVAAAVVTKAA